MAAMLVVSCAVHRGPPCVSKCGMLLEDEGNGAMSCEKLQEAEDTMLKSIDEKFCSMDSRMCYHNACMQCFGWQLELDDNVITHVEYDIGVKPDGGTISVRLPAVGLSNCETKQMWLGANQTWRKGSYPHEIFHVIQECQTGWDGGIDASKGPGHEGWQDHGIYDFIKEYRDGYR